MLNSEISEQDVAKAVQCAQFGDLATLIQLHKAGKVAHNTVDREGCSLLQWAAINNRIDIAEFLLEIKTDYTFCGGKLNENALQWAVRMKNIEMAHLLLCWEKETSTETKSRLLEHTDICGDNAIHLACQTRDSPTLFVLLAHGANPDSTIRRPDANAPMSDVDPNSPSCEGYSPLMYICQKFPHDIDMV